MSETPRPEPQDEEPTGEDGVDIDAILRQLGSDRGADERGEAEAAAPVGPGEAGAGPRLFSVVVAALDAQGLNYHAEAEYTRVFFTLRCESAAFDVRLLVNERADVVTCYVQLPVWVPVERRTAMCEAIARATYGLPVGGFEMDLSDGDLLFKSGIDVEGGTLSPAMVHNLVSACVNPADRYYPAFMRVIYADATPEAAIDEAES